MIKDGPTLAFTTSEMIVATITSTGEQHTTSTNPNPPTHTPMTYTEHEEFAAIEKTCDEIRQENVELLSTIMLLRHHLDVIVRLNTLGKTKEIADLIATALK
jgi:hypothetical protein